jgi:hypothetical protein
MPQTPKLWVMTAEIVVKPDELPSGNTNAFVNIVTWADSADHAEQNLSQCLESYGCIGTAFTYKPE